jgi:hypothetical protein
MDMSALKDVVSFCENRTVCRNVKIASFLNELPISCSRDSPSCCAVCGSNVCITIVSLEQIKILTFLNFNLGKI